MSDSYPDPTVDAGQAPTPSAPPSAASPDVSMPPDYVRNSPEYRELQARLRAEARARGSAEAALAAARSEAEQARAAAEAQAAVAREEQMRAILGDEGLALWQRVADLSASDPVEAARAFAGLRDAAVAAGLPAPTAPSQAAAPSTGASSVETPPAPPGAPEPPSGLDAGAPLGSASPADDLAATIAASEKAYADVVERVQNPVTRNRVTMRDRQAAMENYLTAAYMKAGVPFRK